MKENSSIIGESSNGRKAVFETVNVGSTPTSPSISKVCTQCEQRKELKEFAKKLTRTSSECKECHQKASKAKYNDKERTRVRADKARRVKIAKEYVADLKAKSQCKCGYKGIALQFHHVGAKDLDVSSAVSGGWSLDRLKKEINKCVILCANCHMEEHLKE